MQKSTFNSIFFSHDDIGKIKIGSVFQQNVFPRKTNYAVRARLQYLGLNCYLDICNDAAYIKSGYFYSGIFNGEETIQVGLNHRYVSRSETVKSEAARQELILKELRQHGKTDDTLTKEQKYKIFEAHSVFLDKNSFHHPNRSLVGVFSTRHQSVMIFLKDSFTYEDERDFFPVKHRQHTNNFLTFTAGKLASFPADVPDFHDETFEVISEHLEEQFEDDENRSIQDIVFMSWEHLQRENL